MLIGWIGILLAGCISGSFTVPARRLHTMPWNGAWLVYCVVANLLIPCLLGLLITPTIFSRVFPEHAARVVIVMLTGVLFGCGAFLFGSCVPRLGVALSNSIVSGTVAFVGSLAPLVTGTTKLGAADLRWLLTGLMILAGGIAASCHASLLRDRSRDHNGPTYIARRSIASVLLAFLAGCLASMLNAGFAYGQPLVRSSVDAGINPAVASLAVWIPVLFGAFVTNVFATHWRLQRDGEYALLRRAPLTDWLRAAAMGLLWMGATLIYGASAEHLGASGIVYGWAVYVGASIMVAILWGIWLGEWSNTSAQAKLWLLTSLLLIMLSLAVLSIHKR